MSYDNNDHSAQISIWVKHSWGLGRLYRRMTHLYPYHGPTILLRQIIMIAEKEGVRFRWRTIYSVMKKEAFEPTEKTAIKNWVNGLENGRTYTQETSPNTRLQSSLANTPIRNTTNETKPLKTRIEVRK